MPELPEVENVVRSLRPGLLGRRITEIELPSSGQNGAGSKVLRRLLVGSAQAFCENLRGGKVLSIKRYGKNILITLQPRDAANERLCLLIHLGMTGRLRFESMPEPLHPHTHFIFALDEPASWLHFTDPRRFGKINLSRQVPDEIQHLGPDPLEISQEEFCARLRGRKTRLKALLLDQQFVRGLGNIYADESLFRAGIHPAAVGSRLRRQRGEKLWDAIRATLCQAIELGGSSISSYMDAEGRAGRFQQLHQVYGRTGEPCDECGSPVRRVVIAGRSTHFCRICQPPQRRRISKTTKSGKRSR